MVKPPIDSLFVILITDLRFRRFGNIFDSDEDCIVRVIGFGGKC